MDVYDLTGKQRKVLGVKTHHQKSVRKNQGDVLNSKANAQSGNLKKKSEKNPRIRKFVEINRIPVTSEDQIIKVVHAALSRAVDGSHKVIYLSWSKNPQKCKKPQTAKKVQKMKEKGRKLKKNRSIVNIPVPNEPQTDRIIVQLVQLFNHERSILDTKNEISSKKTASTGKPPKLQALSMLQKFELALCNFEKKDKKIFQKTQSLLVRINKGLLESKWRSYFFVDFDGKRNLLNKPKIQFCRKLNKIFSTDNTSWPRAAKPPNQAPLWPPVRSKTPEKRNFFQNQEKQNFAKKPQKFDKSKCLSIESVIRDIFHSYGNRLTLKNQRIHFDQIFKQRNFSNLERIHLTNILKTYLFEISGMLKHEIEQRVQLEFKNFNFAKVDNLMKKKAVIAENEEQIIKDFDRFLGVVEKGVKFQIFQNRRFHPKEKFIRREAKRRTQSPKKHRKDSEMTLLDLYLSSNPEKSENQKKSFLPNLDKNQAPESTGEDIQRIKTEESDQGVQSGVQSPFVMKGSFDLSIDGKLRNLKRLSPNMKKIDFRHNFEFKNAVLEAYSIHKRYKNQRYLKQKGRGLGLLGSGVGTSGGLNLAARHSSGEVRGYKRSKTYGLLFM